MLAVVWDRILTDNCNYKMTDCILLVLNVHTALPWQIHICKMTTKKNCVCNPFDFQAGKNKATLRLGCLSCTSNARWLLIPSFKWLLWWKLTEAKADKSSMHRSSFLRLNWHLLVSRHKIPAINVMTKHIQYCVYIRDSWCCCMTR